MIQQDYASKAWLRRQRLDRRRFDFIGTTIVVVLALTITAIAMVNS